MQYVLGHPIHAMNGGLTVRIADDARKCVVFFGQSAPPAGEIEYGGTGFIVSLPHDGMASMYLLTCRHVARRLEKTGGFVIRANLKQGGSEPLQVDHVEWAYHPDKTVDLAATDFYFGPDVDHASYALEGTLNRMTYKAHCGDPVNIVGLFRLHSGTHRSTPIVHCGHIAALADAKERVPLKDRTTKEKIEAEVHLVEAQTLEGLSGSPVFTHFYVRLRDMVLPEGGHPLAHGLVKLLGLYIGAWDGEAGELRVPLGMGLVVPFEKIMELLMDHPVLKDHRKQRLEYKRSRDAAVMDSGFSAHPAVQAEPAKAEPGPSALTDKREWVGGLAEWIDGVALRPK